MDCGQNQILTDPRNGLKNRNMNFGNDQSVGWEEFDDRRTDRQTDRRLTDRQTEKSNPSVPHDTFACFAGLITMTITVTLTMTITLTIRETISLTNQ